MKLLNFRNDAYTSTLLIDDRTSLWVPWIYDDVRVGIGSDDPMFNSTILEVEYYETV